MKRIEILGVEIDNVTMEETLDRVNDMVRSGQPHQIVTPAIEQMVNAHRYPEFKQTLRDAELVVPDGMQVVFASRLHGTPLKERITGVDLVPKMCELAAREGYSVFFLGAAEGVAEAAARILKNDSPELTVAGCYSPPFRFEEDPREEAKTIAIVREAKPDILFVAMSAPRQENWIHRRKRELGASVTIGIGGSFNFITGREKRAPLWMQKLGLEGLYRFIKRPRDIWKRVLISVPIYLFMLFDRLSYRRQKQIARWVRPIVLGAGDAMLAPLTFLGSYWFYFRSGIFSNTADPFPEYTNLLDMPAYSDLLVVVSILGVLALWIHRLYVRDKYMDWKMLLIQLGKSALSVLFLSIVFQFLFFKDIFREYQFLGYSRVVFGFFGLSFLIALFAWRWGFLVFDRFLHRRGLNMDRIIVVGTNPTAMEIVSAMKQCPEMGNLPLGYVVTQSNFQPTPDDGDRLGDIADLERLLPARKVDEVLIADSSLSMPDLLAIVRVCQRSRVTLSIVPTLHELLGVSSEIKRIGDFRVITVHPDRHVDDWIVRNQENPS